MHEFNKKKFLYRYAGKLALAITLPCTTETTLLLESKTEGRLVIDPGGSIVPFS